MSYISAVQAKQIAQKAVDNLKDGTLVPKFADNLTPYAEDSGTTQENPFISQGTGTDNNSIIVTTGSTVKQLEKQGNTVVKNQLVKSRIVNSTGNGITIASTGDYKYTVTVNNATGFHQIDLTNYYTFQSGHKYLVCGSIINSQGVDIEIYISGYSSNVSSQYVASLTDDRTRSYFYVSQTTPNGTYTIYPYIIDITTYPASVITDLTSHPEHFSWYYNGSLAYDAGSLQNCNGRYLECGQGRNLFAGNSTDSSQYIGHYYIDSNSNYSKSANTNYNCYRVLVTPNRPIMMSRSDGSNLATYAIKRYVDKDFNLISGDIVGYNARYAIVTPPAGTRYIEFSLGLNQLLTNVFDVQFYYSPEEGGEGYIDSNNAPIHYPYVAPIRIDTGNETLKAFDKKLPSGVIEKNTLPEIDMGDLTYTKASDGYFTATVTGMLPAAYTDDRIVCSKYSVAPVTQSSMPDKSIRYYGSNQPVIFIHDTAYQESSDVKTGLAGVKLQVLSATPTTEQGTPFSEYAPINDYSYMAWFDTDGNLVSIPQGCKLFYPVDYKGFVDDLVMYTDGDATSLVRKTDYASSSQAGVVKVGDGLTYGSTGFIYTNRAEQNAVKLGENLYRPIVSGNQHQSVFYGLAKAAGANLASGTAETAPDGTNPGVYPEAAKEAICQMIGASRSAQNVHHYTVRWNKTQAQMTRLNDAAFITTTVTNFAHRGRVNTNYNNPFDNIYPWSGRKLCNIDIDRYCALSAGESLTKCVKAWEGDVDFSYNDTNGVWVYTPEFWGKTWSETVSGTNYRYFDVTDKACGGYVHYPESIDGRWHGRTATKTIGGTDKTCLLPTVGMPAKRIALSTLHTYAKNWGAMLDSIYSIDAHSLLMVVEFATMNSQNAIGSGVSSMYRESNDLIQAAVTDSNVITVVKSAIGSYAVVGAIIDIGTSNGGNQVGSYSIVSTADNAGDNTLLDITLDQTVTVTTAHYWSIHGMVNKADEDIGSKSGYIGTNGKSIAYYRGIELFGNMWFYILGAYRQTGTQHVFIANSDAEADNYDAINASVHYDTGIVLASSQNWVNALGELNRSGLLCIPPFATAVGSGASDANPVGDYHYISASAGNTVLIRGGYAYGGASDGAFCGNWNNAASGSNWYYAARPRLKTPQ